MTTATATKWQEINTTNWHKVEFIWKGYRLVSSISLESPLLQQILRLPEGLFVAMNITALDEVMKSGESINELLDRINEGASHAIVSLA